LLLDAYQQRKNTMTEDTLAKPLVKDRFWILSRNGESVGLLNRIGDSHYVVTDHGRKIAFNSKKTLLDKYPIRFIKHQASDVAATYTQKEVHGYPINSKKAFNVIYDLNRKLPMFNKREDSKCWFCAGHYIINFTKIGWTTASCPKLITLDRYGYKGPYKTAEDAKEALKYAKHST